MSDPRIEDSIQVAARRLLRLSEPPVTPAELLGLPHSPETWLPQLVSRALLDRLSVIDEHPQARTPEADELRVALHVAAAQLRDPSVRERLSTRDPLSSRAATMQEVADPLEAPGAVEVGSSPGPASIVGVAEKRNTATGVVNQDFRIAVEHVLATCGGWNSESKRRLGYLARSASVDAGGLQQALVSITRQHEQPVLSETANTMAGRTVNGETEGQSGSVPRAWAGPRPKPTSTQRPLDHRVESVRARTWMTIGTVIMFAASLTIAVGLLTFVVQELLSSPPPIETRVVSATPPSATPRVTVSSSESLTIDGDDQNRGSGLASPISADTDGLIRYLQSLDADAFRNAPDQSTAGFESVYRRLAGSWYELDRDTLDAAAIGLRDSVLAASEAGQVSGRQVLDVFLADFAPLESTTRVNDPLAAIRAVFAFSTASLLIDTPIDPRDERSLRSRLNTIASGLETGRPDSRSFESHASVALRLLAVSGKPRPSDSDDQAVLRYWDAWVDMTDAFEAQERALLILDAAELISTQAEDPGFHQPTRTVLARLVRAVRWSEDHGRLASSRLLAWFDQLDFPSASLSAITEELVDEALLPGLDASMKLSKGSLPQDRVALRDQYALRTSHPQIGEGRQFASEWAGFAIELLEEGVFSTPMGALDRAVRAARLNEAAALWSASSEKAARVAMDRGRIGLQELAANSGGPVAFGGGRPSRVDGEWAARYLQAMRNAEERSMLLYELENTGGPAGEADADVLAEAASYSTPIEIRRQAQSLVVAYADRQVVLIGLLEVLPRAAAQENVSSMIETVTGRRLPNHNDQEWRVAARRSLVARLLELLADQDERYLDVARDVLEASILSRSSLLPVTAPQRSPDALQLIEDSMLSGEEGTESATGNAPIYADRLLQAAKRYPQRAVLFATLTEIESRRVWRDRLVDSETGKHAAQTTSIFELMAYILGSEQPERAEAVNAIVENAAAARRSASSVYEQIAINELSILRLNLLRLGV